MGLFEKKFDIVEDRLRIVFNPQTKSYNVYYGATLIPYSKLSRKSKKHIENDNNNLRTNPDILAYEMERATVKQRFNELRSLGYTCGSFEYLGEVNGTMSKEMEEILTKLTTEENVLLGIHRIKDPILDTAIQDMLTNGLKMTGHNDGGIPSTNVLANNVSYYADNKIIIKELMYADLFKNAKGSILIRIPDNELSPNIYIRDSEGCIRLNPKYIVGYVPLYENHHLETIITPQSLLKTNSSYGYTFQERTNDNQVYQQESEHKIRR